MIITLLGPQRKGYNLGMSNDILPAKRVISLLHFFFDFLLSSAVAVGALGCGWMKVAYLEDHPTEKPPMKVSFGASENGLTQSSSEIQVNEGYGVVLFVHLNEAQPEDLILNLEILSQNDLLPADHFAPFPKTLTIPVGSTSAFITLTSLENSIFYLQNNWTLSLGPVNASDSERATLSLSILDNDSETATPSMGSRTSGGSQLCAGSGALLSNSGGQPNGEYSLTVTPSLVGCSFHFQVKGAGGGSASSGSNGGNGGRNEFIFSPQETGVFRLVIGGGGRAALGNYGGTGGGSSSVMFDPDGLVGTNDAYMLSIAGGGGGSGTVEFSEHGGAGGGSGPGEQGLGQDPNFLDGGGANGSGTGGTSIDAPGGSCLEVELCQGGSGGNSDGALGLILGGFGKGYGQGGSTLYGGGGGGGFGGGGASRWNGAGGGGAGHVFEVPAPSMLENLTGSVLGGQGSGGKGGGQISFPNGEDGSVLYSIESPIESPI